MLTWPSPSQSRAHGDDAGVFVGSGVLVRIGVLVGGSGSALRGP
jgi:hypothetical protein